MAKDETTRIRAYHERTKHHLQRYARSPGYMDWANQPNPFRLFSGTRRTPLPLPFEDPHRNHRALYDRSGLSPKRFAWKP